MGSGHPAYTLRQWVSKCEIHFLLRPFCKRNLLSVYSFAASDIYEYYSPAESDISEYYSPAARDICKYLQPCCEWHLWILTAPAASDICEYLQPYCEWLCEYLQPCCEWNFWIFTALLWVTCLCSYEMFRGVASFYSVTSSGTKEKFETEEQRRRPIWGDVRYRECRVGGV